MDLEGATTGAVAGGGAAGGPVGAVLVEATAVVVRTVPGRMRGGAELEGAGELTVGEGDGADAVRATSAEGGGAGSVAETWGDAAAGGRPGSTGAFDRMSA